MAEETVVSISGLLSLPVEVLHVVGEYLCPQDLLSVSESCRYLRSAFNVNSLWRGHTEGGWVSRGLDRMTSLVEPKFEKPYTSSLEPLCEHRLHFLKQSRLLNNLRQGKFVEHSTEFDGVLSQYANDKITYGSKFLFTVDSEGDKGVIRIFDIEISPTLLLTVNPENHPCHHDSILLIKVVGDKLVVQREDWCDVYDIRLPESLDISYSFNIDKQRTELYNDSYIIGRFMLVKNFTLNVAYVWDLSNGNQRSDIYPRTIGPNFNILGYSQKELLVVLSVGIHPGESSDVFVYDLESQDFSPFKLSLNERDFTCRQTHGLINSDYVVLLNEISRLNYSAFVFDYKNSTLVVEKLNSVSDQIRHANIVDGYLVVPSLVSVLVMSLKTLETVWELQLDTAGSLVYAFPLISVVGMKILHMPSLSSIIVIHKVSGVEMWDLSTRRKFLDWPEKVDLVMNDTYSKLIFCDSRSMKVLSFW